MDRVLVIDESEIPGDVVDGLRALGFQVDAAVGAAAGVQQVQQGLHHIIIIDEAVPPVVSARLLVDLRRITQGPIVVMGRGGETALVEALMRGADLYVDRTVQPMELAARIHALVRRCHKCASIAGVDEYLDELGAGDQLDQVFDRLSHTEAKLLRFLLERDGRLTAREELMAGVWGESGKETSLRFYIWQLRRKLNGAGRIEILNMKGMGYLLKVRPAV